MLSSAFAWKSYALQGLNFDKPGQIEYGLAKIKAKPVFLAWVFILFGLDWSSFGPCLNQIQLDLFSLSYMKYTA